MLIPLFNKDNILFYTLYFKVLLYCLGMNHGTMLLVPPHQDHQRDHADVLVLQRGDVIKTGRIFICLNEY